jgi:hypothetical protein
LELAGIETDDKPKPRSRPKAVPTAFDEPEPSKSAFNDAIPQDFQAAPPPLANADDDDFLKFIEEDVKKASDKREARK